MISGVLRILSCLNPCLNGFKVLRSGEFDNYANRNNKNIRQILTDVNVTRPQDDSRPSGMYQ